MWLKLGNSRLPDPAKLGSARDKARLRSTEIALEDRVCPRCGLRPMLVNGVCSNCRYPEPMSLGES